MSFQIQRNNEKKKTQISNEDGSSPMSQLEDYEIDKDSIIFGDIVKHQERSQKKKPTITSLLKSSPKKVNPNDIIKLSLDKKKCTSLFEEDKLYEFSQRSLNPTQYRIHKKKQSQNGGSPSPTPKKHYSNKVMPEAFISLQSSVNNGSEMLSSQVQQQRNTNQQQVSAFVTASIIQLQQQETHTTLLDKLSFDEFFLIATNAQVMILQNRGYYEALLKQKSYYPSNYFDKIKQDVGRSFPQQQEEKQKFQNALDNVLCAVAIRNPYIHYCQGMNYIGVFILKYITQGDEEETFWILVQLLESVLSLEMYNNPEFFVYYINMLEEYFKIEFSDIYEKLKKNQIQFLMYPFNEIFTLFTNQIQPEIAMQIWMNLVVSGQRSLFKSMIALLNTCRQQLTKADNFNTIHNILQSLKQFNDKEEFLKEYNKFYINKRAFKMALNAYSEIQRQTGSADNKNFMLDKINDKCNLNSPICLHIQQMIKVLKRSFSFFVYKTSQTIEPTIMDYFSADKNQNDFNKLQNQQQKHKSPKLFIPQPLADFEKPIETVNLDDLMVGRFYHMCEIIEQRLNGQMNGSSYSPQKLIGKSFRTPQFLSVKKIIDCDTDNQLNLQDSQFGTDPIPVFKNTSSIILSPNREKSKTHSSSYSKDFSDQLPELNSKKDTKFNTMSMFASQQYNGEYDEDLQNTNLDDDDEDGNYTYMFGQRKESPEQIIRPRRRKSINWEGTGSDSQPKQDPLGVSEGLSIDNQFQQHSKFSGDNFQNLQDSQEQSISSNSTVRSRSSIVNANNNNDIHKMLMIQMAAASQQFSAGSVDNNKQQKILKF